MSFSVSLTPSGPWTSVGNSVRATVLQGDRGTDAYYRDLTSHVCCRFVVSTLARLNH
ncbi:hypothetical protein [Streptomyces sp. ALI-76-A]|jgi:hypothetical protein|uniref:hypothetical protein n=1 Tax=Streptomyces sp. ALI-76-A TaxID=3025736 RepID=UPI00256ED99B|nr:hypothetical protein [Streptomyces sp. ALI-76-A]MDL5198903.1 hypothetical protein [Streptomyces sp. ALI-76-A]